MNPTKLKLTNPTDDELSAAVAEHVAHAIPPEGEDYMWSFRRDGGGLTLCSLPSFATSADAVLPLLEKLPFWTAQFDGRQFTVTDGHMDEDSDNMASAAALPRAACIALLRANGIEVEVTP